MWEEKHSEVPVPSGKKWYDMGGGKTGLTTAGINPSTSLYYAHRVEDYGGKDVWWEVINNKTGACIAAVTDHDAAHNLVYLFTKTQVILAQHMKKE